MNRVIAYIMLALASVFAHQAMGQGRLTVRAVADSTVLVMGDQTGIKVEVVKNGHAGTLVDMPQKETDYYGLELVDCTVDSAELGNDRVQVNYNMTFQAFYPSDLLTLPPFRYAQAGDTAQSDLLTFKVYPIPLSPELGNIENLDSLTIHPDEEAFVIPARWYDGIPNWITDYWWIFVVVTALIGAIGVLLALYRKNGPSILPVRKPLPPYELAMRELTALKERRLLERGEAKTFYTEVIDILRRYLQGRFGINAMEMTSKQIVNNIREHNETHMSAQQIEQTLQIADIVKFAAQNPNPEEGQRTYNTIYNFVEMTKPQPEPSQNPQRINS